MRIKRKSLLSEYTMRQTRPLFTIITPCFNPGNKMVATIESVLSQHPGLFEYWVIDGGSSDGTVDLLTNTGNHVQWISEPDGGVYDAMNKGIARSRGDYLYFLGAGDVLKPGILETMADVVPSDRAALVYGNVFWVGDDPVYGGTVYAGQFSKERIVNLCPNHQSIFYHRSIFELVGRYSPDYRILADWHLNLKCFGDDRISKIYVDIIVADYEGGGVSSCTIDKTFFRRRTLLVARYLGARYAWQILSERPNHWLASRIALLRYLASRHPTYLAKRVWHHLRLKLRKGRV